MRLFDLRGTGGSPVQNRIHSVITIPNGRAARSTIFRHAWYHRPPCLCRSLFALLPSLFLIPALTGCASTPRITEVSAVTRAHTVESGDHDLYLRDRITQFHFDAASLPAEQQRQEFLVRWTGQSVTLVKFEYRQVKHPNTIHEQTYDPARPAQRGDGRRWTIFQVAGDAYATGGSVSAWRVSLWNNDQFLAEKKSVLW